MTDTRFFMVLYRENKKLHHDVRQTLNLKNEITHIFWWYNCPQLWKDELMQNFLYIETPTGATWNLSECPFQALILSSWHAQRGKWILLADNQLLVGVRNITFDLVLKNNAKPKKVGHYKVLEWVLGACRNFFFAHLAECWTHDAWDPSSILMWAIRYIFYSLQKYPYTFFIHRHTISWWVYFIKYCLHKKNKGIYFRVCLSHFHFHPRNL